MNVAMGTFCLATQTAWQLAKLLLWHSCQSTYAGIGVRLACRCSALSKFPIKCTMEEFIFGFKAVEVCVCDGGIW